MKPRVVLAALVVVTACAAGPDGELLVSAASSLTDAFAEIESGFEAEHPDIDIVLNLGATSTLRRQILEGAPADVFASADTINMDQVVAADLASRRPKVFATNRLQIAVRRGNPTGLQDLSDLADPERVIGLCAVAVPCGRLARLALESAGITPSVDSEEPNVRALLTKIAAGEIDAGIVYQSDVTAENGVEGIPIPPGNNQVNQY
ncbi:MAG: molybdate ABC transporter substrate-binding protein, partial [Acidimicrobiia bacterium]